MFRMIISYLIFISICYSFPKQIEGNESLENLTEEQHIKEINKKYINHLKALENKLKACEAIGKSQNEIIMSLEKFRKFKLEEFEKQNKLLDSVKNDLKNFKNVMKKIKGDIVNNNLKLKHIGKKIDDIKRQILLLKKGNIDVSVKERKEKINQLRKELIKFIELNSHL